MVKTLIHLTEPEPELPLEVQADARIAGVPLSEAAQMDHTALAALAELTEQGTEMLLGC